MKRLKVTQKETEQLNLRSDEVKEIMGHIPTRIIRYGISIIAFIITGIFIFSFFFKYPDVINGAFYVQSANPPTFMLSASNGKVQALLVADKDTVQNGQLLAMVENSTDIDAYLQVKGIVLNKKLNKDGSLLSAVSLSCETDSIFNVLPVINQLGALQTVYSNLYRSYKDYLNFRQLDYHQRKIDLLENKQTETFKQIKLQKQQLHSAQKAYGIAVKEFSRDSLLFMDNTIAAAEFQKAQKNLVNQKMSLTNTELNLSNSQMALAELESQIIELQLKQTQESDALDLAFGQALEKLKGELAEWEKRYCLISPIKGRVALSGIWEENQNIRSGQHVMTIVPFERSQLLAKVIIPVSRAGKVKVQQSVNLKFADFPYREYGMVNALLNAISEVPDSAYIGTIYLNDSLVSNYGKQLPFKQNMQGMAEIITDDLTLAERMIYPLRAIFEEHVN
ncbi:HlyD family efflux transporter periplasmic adaptor subunit [Carboxylicivirga sp. M1479]|uniref:HlyD family efflux transporter periplasmic adaptor subunit n=1 Tax=Carboxylicivirga sp. M1479 TaxID=2594476 RepID=UPI00117759DA|nr:HlyD family efflux transporter periplasmic adaptor subunit [Carboxylicivirga sp. M1479]TRX65890.1 HlyD family efflux transporter periplasmic adaptor subunit [Carboxylicivirga sp. M1479]